MKPQEPAEGILKLNDWGKSIWYQVTCNCGEPDHAHTVEIEADDHAVSVHIYVRTKTRFWQQSRWRDIWNLLVNGYTEYEATVILEEQQAINYASALTKAVDDVKMLKDEQKNKTSND